MTSQDKLNQENMRMLVDVRTQERNMKYLILTQDVLKHHLSKLPDVSSKLVAIKMTQPALGSFDTDELKHIQDNFQRHTNQVKYNSPKLVLVKR